jgi:hypothetical protein
MFGRKVELVERVSHDSLFYQQQWVIFWLMVYSSAAQIGFLLFNSVVVSAAAISTSVSFDLILTMHVGVLLTNIMT